MHRTSQTPQRKATPRADSVVLLLVAPDPDRLITLNVTSLALVSVLVIDLQNVGPELRRKGASHLDGLR